MGFVVGIHGEGVDVAGSDHTLTTASQQVVGFHMDHDGPANACTYNGDALTSIVATTYLRAFGTLSSYTVTNGACVYPDYAGGYVTYALTGLKSLTAVDAGVASTGTNTSKTLTVTGTPGGLVLAACFLDNDEAMTMTVAGSSVADLSSDVGGPDHIIMGHYVMGATETSVNIAFAWDGGNQQWQASGVCLIPTRLAGSPMWWT